MLPLVLKPGYATEVIIVEVIATRESTAATNQSREPEQGTRAGNQSREPEQETRAGNQSRKKGERYPICPRACGRKPNSFATEF